MLGMDLSTLNGAQLRRVLEVARARNQTELARQLQIEMNARRSRPREWRGTLVTDTFEEPAFALDDEVGPESPVDHAGRPAINGNGAGSSESWWRELKREAEAPPPPPPRKTTAILWALLAALIAAGLGWQLTAPRVLRDAEPAAVPAKASPPAAGAMRPAASVATRTPGIAAPEAAVRPRRPDREVVANAPATPAGRAKPEAAAEAAPKPKSDSCRARANAADRLVCGYPVLAARERQMRQAYERALAAGADRAAVDRAQAQWRAERDRATDRARLAALYARRTRELEATAAAARVGSPVAQERWRVDEALVAPPTAPVKRRQR